MGKHDSSLTRVRPVFNALLELDPTGHTWLTQMCRLAAMNAGRSEFGDVGTLLEGEVPSNENLRMGTVFERTVPPSGGFLHWLLSHPSEVRIRDRVNFGAKGEEAIRWRKLLFSSEEHARRRAQTEGLTQLLQLGANQSRHKWWAFEGFSHIDCCLITNECVLFVEGKRTESVSASTQWFSNRSQLWRNVECARIAAQGKKFGVILGVEIEAHGASAMEDAAASLVSSLPHLDGDSITTIENGLIGWITWRQLVDQFGLPESCLVEQVEEPHRRLSESATLAGVDGCPGGWVVAVSDSNLSHVDFEVVDDIRSVFSNPNYEHIAIDIPVGLPQSITRDCDVLARRSLAKGQGSRVFPAPCRDALRAESYQHACELNRQASGKALSQQAYAIISKIKQVDDAITPDQQQRIREVHPEVSFASINGKPLQHSKSTRDGQEERLGILNSQGVHFDPWQVRRSLGNKLVNIDDLLDAAVALVTARRIRDGVARVLGGTQLDARSLRMEIVA